jgi:Rps23 Pro-64 3,4-dihydroxylase Tpa1-like proline 4-hydroxylase
MNNLNDVFTMDIFKSDTNFLNAKPFPMAVIDNFLPNDFAIDMYNEISLINDNTWKEFTRNGSHMFEFNRLGTTPAAFKLMSYLHSSYALEKLTNFTGIEGLIPDPHLIGAGYSKSYTGDTLQVHTDFNWNNTLKLHRALSLIIYLTPDWDINWNGGLDFYNEDRNHIVTHVDCLFNRCLIWKYNKFGWHGHTSPLKCPIDKPRTTFRLFYYTSNSTFLDDDPPHRSQYWYDPIEKKPYDKRNEK